MKEKKIDRSDMITMMITININKAVGSRFVYIPIFEQEERRAMVGMVGNGG